MFLHDDSEIVFTILLSSGYSKTTGYWTQIIPNNLKNKGFGSTSTQLFVGETVTKLWEIKLSHGDWTAHYFNHDSYSNRTMRNFSSNRIHIDPAAPGELTIHQIQASDAGNYSCYPAAMGWTLTITSYYVISSWDNFWLHLLMNILQVFPSIPTYIFKSLYSGSSHLHYYALAWVEQIIFAWMEQQLLIMSLFVSLFL